MALTCVRIQSISGSPTDSWNLRLEIIPPGGLPDCPYLLMTGGEYNGLIQSNQTAGQIAELQTSVSLLMNTVNSLISSMNSANSVDLLSLGINPTSVLSVFGFGFGAVMLFWFLGFCLSLCLNLIRKA